MSESSLLRAWQQLPTNASEALVTANFVLPHLFEALGFSERERVPEFQTGLGGKAVDFAARRNITGEDIFIDNKVNPNLLTELKGRDINLAESSAQYASTVRQLHQYMLSSKCHSVQWAGLFHSKL